MDYLSALIALLIALQGLLAQLEAQSSATTTPHAMIASSTPMAEAEATSTPRIKPSRYLNGEEVRLMLSKESGRAFAERLRQQIVRTPEGEQLYPRVVFGAILYTPEYTGINIK